MTRTSADDPGVPRSRTWFGGLRIDWPPIALAAAALLLLVWLGRGMTFYHDEWAMILKRDLSLDGILAPHNEHLSATLVVLYRVLLGTVGMASYWPYLGVTFALHLVVAGLVYAVVRSETRDRSRGWALGAMAVMLVLGAGGDDILWAFQSATIGAVAGGIGAIVVAPRRPGLAAALLTVAVATSGASLAFLAGTGVRLLLERPRTLVWLIVPVGLYLAWYVTYGATGVAALRSPSLDGVAPYVAVGLAASAGGALGTTMLVVGGLAALVLVAGLAWTRPVPTVVLALLAAGVAFYVIAGSVRAELGAEQAAASRYLYIVAPSFLVAGAIVFSRLPKPAGVRVATVVLAVALVGNLALLVGASDRLLSKVECERSMTPLARGSAGNPC
ncbi:MAG: hypothetical protein ABIZ72_05425 [Candidatus Limnocylindrales bacterium]